MPGWLSAQLAAGEVPRWMQAGFFGVLVGVSCYLAGQLSLGGVEADGPFLLVGRHFGQKRCTMPGQKPLTPWEHSFYSPSALNLPGGYRGRAGPCALLMSVRLCRFTSAWICPQEEVEAFHSPCSCLDLEQSLYLLR